MSGDPVFSPAPGSYSTDIEVSIDAAGATVYYTIADDPSLITDPVPGTAGTFELGPGETIPITGPNTSKTIRAISIADQFEDSNIVQATYTVAYPVASAPTFTLPGGTYFTTQSVTLSSPQGGEIYYTSVAGYGPAPTPVPGVAPTLLYTGAPIAVNEITTIRAIAVVPGLLDSPEAEATFVLKVQTPVADPPPMYYGWSPDVTISSPTPSSLVAVTLDTGTDPVPSPGDPSAFSMSWISWTAEFRAIGHRSGWEDSDVAVFRYNDPADNEYDYYDQATVADWDPQMTITNIPMGPSMEGAVILYRTNEGRYGKMVIYDFNFDGNGGFHFQFTTYNADGSVHVSSTTGQMRGSWPFDFDTGVEVASAPWDGCDAWNQIGVNGPLSPGMVGFLSPPNDSPMFYAGTDLDPWP